jgi:hypothetical protein
MGQLNFNLYLYSVFEFHTQLVQPHLGDLFVHGAVVLVQVVELLPGVGLPLPGGGSIVVTLHTPHLLCIYIRAGGGTRVMGCTRCTVVILDSQHKVF